MRSRLHLAAAPYQTIMRGGETVSAISEFSGKMQAHRPLQKKVDDLVKKT
jgi:hypothetical protein